MKDGTRTRGERSGTGGVSEQSDAGEECGGRRDEDGGAGGGRYRGSFPKREEG